MNEKNRNLLLRAVSALVLLPIVLLLVALGGPWSTGLLSVAAAAGTGEYYAITLKRLSPAAWVGVVVAGVLPFLPLRGASRTGEAAFWLVAGFLIFTWVYHLLRATERHEAPTKVGHLLTGLLYGSVGMTAMSALRLLPRGMEWAIAAMVITWANDTAAYFAGRFLGRHKLLVEVSPNKTWEGFFGGMVGSVGGMLLARELLPLFNLVPFTVLDCVLLGVGGAVLGPLGDLCESMLKRAYGVKDSGWLIPGHGGMLDRVDALLFNAPLVFAYVKFLRDWLL